MFLQPAGRGECGRRTVGVTESFGNLGGPVDGVPVLPPFRVNPADVSPGLESLGLTYLPGTESRLGVGPRGVEPRSVRFLADRQGSGDHGLPHASGYSVSLRASPDAFTVGDGYHCSIFGPTNPNRCYHWTGCIGNVNYLGAGGVDGQGSGPVTGNGLGVNNAYYVWHTFPEVLQTAGISWKIYQDLAGTTFAPDLGDGTGNSFAGNYTDNPILYFNQYATAPKSSPLFLKGCTGTNITPLTPAAGAPETAWQAWAEHLFDQFRSDVKSGKLPQVSWIVAPAGYTEHPDWPSNYGAWYISQIFDILVANPDVFSKTVFIVNYDENDGGFDHMVPPTPPQTAAKRRLDGEHRERTGDDDCTQWSDWVGACGYRSWRSRPGARADTSTRKYSTTPR